MNNIIINVLLVRVSDRYTGRELVVVDIAVDRP